MIRLTILVLLPILINANCPVSTEYWCSSPEVASKCGVLEQCRKHEWFVNSASPVSIELYFESLCPGCRMFITTQLFPVWKELSNIMNVTLIPYGNAQEQRVGNKWNFQCQHGKEECVGNLIEACAINILKDVNIWFPFLHCIETSRISPIDKAAKSCSISQSVQDYAAIVNCSNSKMGNDLMHQNAIRTGALNPPHQYVPWIVLNGVHTNAIQNKAQQNLKQLVCDTWKGPKPSNCSKKPIGPKCVKNWKANKAAFVNSMLL